MEAIADVAARIGMKPEEVTGIEESPAGLLIHTFDGNTLIEVPEAQPDAAGNSGVMLLSAPTQTYGGNFPIYAQPGAVLPGGATVVPGGYPDGASTHEVMTWVGIDGERALLALRAEEELADPRPKLVAELEAVIARKPLGGTVPGDNPAAEVVQEAEPTEVEYPEDGTVEDVLAWVAGDAERAQEALDAEDDRPAGPRKTLTGELDAILAQTADAQDVERDGDAG